MNSKRHARLRMNQWIRKSQKCVDRIVRDNEAALKAHFRDLSVFGISQLHISDDGTMTHVHIRPLPPLAP